MLRTAPRRTLAILLLGLLALAALISTPPPPRAIAQQNATLTATVDTADQTVDLSISGHQGAWYFKINWWGSCTAVTGTSVNNIGGYQVGTQHSVWAYSDACATQIATTTFTITPHNASLSATVNSDRSVDLNISNWSSNWWFRIDAGSCTLTSGNTVSNIQGYQPGSYGVGAFSKSDCSGFLAAADFTIPDPPYANASLATTVNPGPAVDLTLSNGPANNNWWFRINWWGSCTAVTGTNTVSGISGYSVGTHPVTAYSDSGCNTQIAASSFTIPDVSLAIAVDASDRSVDLTLTGGPSNWWFRIGWWGACTAASGTGVSNIRGYQSGSYLVAVYPAAGCTFGDHITAESFTMPSVTLAAAVNSDRSVDLALSGGPTNWWFRINWWGTCTAASGTSVSGIAGYQDGTHAVAAYSDGGCKFHIASSSFTLLSPSLTTSGVTSTGATLNIASHSGQWWYQANTGPDASCQGPVASGTSTKALTGLTGGTAYIYSAYSDSTCTSANELDSVAFSTSLTVSNLGESTAATSLSVGPNAAKAQEFTTGSAAGGYTLQSVTLNPTFGSLSPGDVVTLRARQSDGTPAATALAALSEATTGSGEVTLTCSGSGCALAADTQYFIHISSSGSSLFKGTASNSETSSPSNNGWSIADAARAENESWNNVTGNGSMKMKVTAVVKPGFTASSVTANSATLTLTGYAGDWWLKRTTPSGGTCAAGESDFSHALNTLTGGTAYVYTAYSDSACTTSNAIASASFGTPLTVSNLSESNGTTLFISSNNSHAQEFTTGSAAGGYTLQSVTLDFDVVYSNADITVTLRARQSTGKPATTALATLSGNPASGQVTFTCSGSGCALAADTQYFIHVSGNLANDGNLDTTASDNEALVPSNSGWSIANAVRSSTNSWNELSTGFSAKMKLTAAPK